MAIGEVLELSFSDGSSVAAPTLTSTNIAAQFYASLNSASSPSYSFTGDTNTGMYSAAADNIQFATGGTKRLDIYAQGIGLNTLDCNDADHFYGATNAAADPTYSFTGDSNTGIYSSSADNIDFATAGTRRMNLNSNGLSLKGASTPLNIVEFDNNSSSYAVTIYNLSTTVSSASRIMNLSFPGAADMSDARFITFDDTTNLGYIRASDASNIALVSVSDERLKTNISDHFDALSIIDKLKPSTYEYKKAPGKIQHGFIAQQVYEVFPEAAVKGDDVMRVHRKIKVEKEIEVEDDTQRLVLGKEKKKIKKKVIEEERIIHRYDPSVNKDEDKNPDNLFEPSLDNPWGVDYSKFGPLAIMAIKQLVEKINILESKILALETN